MTDVPRSVSSRFMSLFSGYTGAHGTHGEPVQQPGKLKWEIKTSARTVREPVTEFLWDQHLAGTRPLGVIPIDSENTCLWGSIDVDQYNVEFAELIRRIDQMGLPLVPCTSKSGGLHLFLFATEPVPAGLMQVVLSSVAARLGLSGSEIFPKQTHVLESRGDLGSWMVMPYYGDTFGGKIKRQVGVNDRGVEQSQDEFLDKAEGSKVAPNVLRELSVSAEVEVERPQRNGSRRSTAAPGREGRGDFTDGPPCLQHLAREGFPEGGRNTALVHVGVYMKRARPGTWKEGLAEVNQTMLSTPLGAEELSGVIKSLSKKEYDYKCRDEPMKSFCDVAKCRARRFGVGDTSEVPKITSMRVLKSEPRIWFVTMADGETIELATAELVDYKRFRLACAEKMHKFYAPMKEHEWVMIVRDASTDLTEVEDERDELSTFGRFRELLEDFLTNRQRGERKEDLVSGRPWENEEEQRHYFRLQDLVKFLKREDARMEDGRALTRGRITSIIRDKMGGGDHVLAVGRSTVNAWFIPSRSIDPTPPAPPPPPETQGLM